MATVARTWEMYNLEVVGNHNFFVGEKGWLVHNACADTLDELAKIAQGANNPFVDKRVKEISTLFGYYDRIGLPHAVPGGLAGAIENQILTGVLVGGKDHLVKGGAAINSYRLLIKQISNSYSIPIDVRQQLTQILMTESQKISSAFATKVP